MAGVPPSAPKLVDYLLTADPSLTSCFSSSCAPALLVSHVVLGSVQSRAGASLQASLTTSGCLPEKPLVSAEGTEALSPCCLSEKAAFTPNYKRLIVKAETCGEGSGSAALWWPPPPFFFFFFSLPHGVRRALPTLVRTIWPPQAGTSCWSRG